MTYEEAKDRLDKHAQYCLDGQDLYALQVVLEQSISVSVLEDIKTEMRQVTDRQLRDYWHICDKFIEIIDKHIGKEYENG